MFLKVKHFKKISGIQEIPSYQCVIFVKANIFSAQQGPE